MALSIWESLISSRRDLQCRKVGRAATCDMSFCSVRCAYRKSRREEMRDSQTLTAMWAVNIHAIT